MGINIRWCNCGSQSLMKEKMEWLLELQRK